MITFEKNWIPYLIRPFDLFGTSLWQSWYDSHEFESVFGFQAKEVLCIQENRGLVHQFRPKTQLDKLATVIRKLIGNPDKFEQLLKKAIEYNRQAQKIIQHNSLDLKTSVSMLNKIAFFGTVLPNFPSLLLSNKEMPTGKVQQLIISLRKVSYYPNFIEKIVRPLAVERLRQLKIKKPNLSVKVVTINELLTGNTKSIAQRLAAQESGKHFIFEQKQDHQIITWESNTDRLIRRFEGKSNNNSISGQIACPGKVTGTVKIILNYTKNTAFEVGDILVAISTNPTWLPLIKKAGAIVTDEGGLTSHAAILSRELGIPCIIGTKIATKVLKDGDVVEVDANTGIIRKL